MRRRNVGTVVLFLLVFVAVLTVYHSQASSQRAQSLSSTQQSEIAEMKKQIAAPEQRVNTLEERLADVYKPKLWPLPVTNELQGKPQEGTSKPQKKMP